MFLIEYEENKFIDAERIDYLGLVNDRVTFTLNSDSGTLFFVDKAIEKQFINKLEDVNKGPCIAARHHHINNPDTKY